MHAGCAIDWIRASDASTGDRVLLPADLCLRRSPARQTIEPVGALSSGAAAGPSFEAAAIRAILELCERDAAAMWWLGGCRPKRFPLEHPATKVSAELMTRLRQNETARRTILLDITTDTAVPAVAVATVASAAWPGVGPPRRGPRPCRDSRAAATPRSRAGRPRGGSSSRSR